MRREIIKILARNSGTVLDVLIELKKRGFNIKYRETIYRAMEKLVDAGFLGKYYVKEKGLCYEVLVSSIFIDVVKGTIIEKQEH